MRDLHVRRAKIYKGKAGNWTVDVTMDWGLLTMMPNVYHLKDGTPVARFYYDTWVEAHKFIFGPDPDEPCECRCQQAKHCGGCGHYGCGYSRDAWVLRA